MLYCVPAEKRIPVNTQSADYILFVSFGIREYILRNLLLNEMAIHPADVSKNVFTRWLIQAFSDVEEFFSYLAALTAKSVNKKGFSTSGKAQIAG